MKYLIISFLFMALTTQAQTNDHFDYTVSTPASPEKIWQIWVDVDHWNQWDSGLKASSIDGEMKLGAKGKLIPDKGPRSKFIVTQFDAGKSYTFKTRIPFGYLVITRRLSVRDGMTYFTHEVMFTGILRKPLGKRIGARYRAMLPDVMKKIASLAETR